MFDRNFTTDIASGDTELRLFSIIAGRARRRLEYLVNLDELNLDDTKFLFDIKCLESIISNSCCLGGLIDKIGGYEFVSIVIALADINWSHEEGMLCAFLNSLLPNIEDEEEDNHGAPSNDVDPTASTKWMPSASPVGM